MYGKRSETMKTIYAFLVVAIFLILNLATLPLAFSVEVLSIGVPYILHPNPLLIEEPINFWMSSLIWQPLTWYENNITYPVIAESWTSTLSETQWIFKLRDNIYFCNGSKLTATDVVSTYNQLINMPYHKRTGSSIWLILSNIKTVQTASNNTVVFQLFKPDKYFPQHVTSNVFILPPYYFKNDNKLHINCGSGMYYIQEIGSNKIVLKYNPFYTGYIPYPETIIFTSDSKPPNKLIYPTLQGTVNYNLSLRLAFNTKKEPFDDWTYRYLLIGTLPFEKIKKWGVPGTPCLIYNTFCSNKFQYDMFLFDPNDFIDKFSIDIEKIQEITIGTSDSLKDIANEIAMAWNQIGINTLVKVFPNEKIFFDPPDTDISLILIGGSQSPYSLASPDLPYSTWNNPSFFLKLSEGITNSQTTISTALNVLYSTIPSTTLLFPKVEITISSEKLRIRTAGIGIPMLTSPIDDFTLIAHSTKPSETSTVSQTTSTQTISQNIENNPLLTYMKYGLIITISLSVALLVVTIAIPKIKTIKDKFMHLPPRVFGSTGATIKQTLSRLRQRISSFLKKYKKESNEGANKTRKKQKNVILSLKERFASLLNKFKVKASDMYKKLKNAIAKTSKKKNLTDKKQTYTPPINNKEDTYDNNQNTDEATAETSESQINEGPSSEISDNITSDENTESNRNPPLENGETENINKAKGDET